MQIIITKHARQRFRERVADLPAKLAAQVIEHMLATSSEYDGPEMKPCVNKVGWLHKSTGTVFVICLNVVNQIKVVTVLRLPGRGNKPIQWREVMSAAGKGKPPGSRKKVSHDKTIVVTDHETGDELLAICPGEKRNVVYVRSLKPYIRSRVVQRKA